MTTSPIRTGAVSLLRRIPGAPARSVAVLAALLVLGRQITAEGGATLLPQRPADLVLVAVTWGKVLLVAAAGGAVVGLAAAAAGGRRDAGPFLSRTASLVAVLAATAAGAVLRFAPGSLLPFRLWGDTLYYVRLALRQPGAVPLQGGTWFGDDAPMGAIVAPNAYAAWADRVLSLFGTGEAGLVALSALPSVAAILAAAWLAGECGGRDAAVAAALLVGLSGWPAVHGRWGYTSVALVPLALAGAAALARAARRAAPGWAAAGGALLGATALTYPAAWPVLATSIPAIVLALRRVERGPLLLASAGVGVLAPLLVVLPAWRGRPDRLGGRARDVWIGAPTRDTSTPGRAGPAGIPVRLAYNVWQYSSLLAGNEDPNPRHFLPGHAPLAPWLGGLALVGGALLARGARPASVLVAGLAAGGLLAGVAASPAAAPNTQRAAVFVVAALVAAGVAVPALTRSGRGFAVALALLGAVLAATEVRPLLGEWASDLRVEGSFLTVEVEAGRLLSRLASDPVVIERGALAAPLAVETLAGAGAPRPLRAARRVAPEELVAGRVGRGRAFWILGRRELLARVDPQVLRVGRGIAPSPLRPDLVLARGVRATP